MLMLLIVLAPPMVGRTPMLLPVVAFSLIGMTTVTLQVFSPIIMTLTAAVMFELTVTTSTVTTSLYWLGDLTVVRNVYLSHYSNSTILPIHTHICLLLLPQACILGCCDCYIATL
jgi:hypothetical protein